MLYIIHIYYYIIYYTYYIIIIIISYTIIHIISYTILFFCSSHSFSPLFLSSSPLHPPSLLFHLLFCSSFHSILVGTYIRLFILFSSSFPSHPNILFSSSLLFSSTSPFSSQPFPLSSSHPNIHSILVGTSIYLFIFLPSSTDNLTPHVLSEWMVEV